MAGNNSRFFRCFSVALVTDDGFMAASSASAAKGVDRDEIFAEHQSPHNFGLGLFNITDVVGPSLIALLVQL